MKYQLAFKLTVLVIFTFHTLTAVSQSQSTVLEVEMKTKEGHWLSKKYVGAQDNKKFKSARKCYFLNRKQLFICEGSYQFEDGTNSGTNSYFFYYYNAIERKVISYGSFAHGGIIEKGVMDKKDGEYKVGYFDYIFQGKKSMWKLKEAHPNENEFVEVAFIKKGGTWKEVNTIHYSKTSS